MRKKDGNCRQRIVIQGFDQGKNERGGKRVLYMHLSLCLGLESSSWFLLRKNRPFRLTLK